MRLPTSILAILVIGCVLPAPPAVAQNLPLETATGLRMHNVQAQP